MPIYDDEQIGKRILLVQKAKGINSLKMAGDIGANPAYLNKVEKGKKPLSERYLEEMLHKYQANPIWILFGLGEMFRPYSLNEKSGIEIPYHLVSTVEKEIKAIHISLGNIQKVFLELSGLQIDTGHPGALQFEGKIRARKGQTQKSELKGSGLKKDM